MSALPWLVMHGGVVWQAALGVLVLGAIVFAWARPRLAARRAARRARADLGAPAAIAHTARGTYVTLAGRLELTGEHTLLHLVDDGGEVVRLEGPMTVLAGSREVWPGSESVDRAVQSGDRIRVQGLLGEEAVAYRDATKRLTLGDELVVAFEGRPRVRGPAARAFSVPALGAGALFLAVFGLGGEIAMATSVHERIAFEVSSSAELPAALSFAAATPFRRHDAILSLARSLEARRDPDPATLAMRASLHELLGERAEAAAMWIAQGEPARGALLAEQAGAFGLATRGWYAAGEFERASDAAVRTTGSVTDASAEEDARFRVGVHLLAERFDRAQADAVRLRAAVGPDGSTPTVLNAWREKRARAAQCLTDALAWRVHARPDRVPGARAEPGTPIACFVLGADILVGQERLVAIDELPLDRLEREEHDVPLAWIDALRAEADVRTTRLDELPFTSAAEVLTIPNGAALARALPGVDLRVAQELAGDRDAQLAVRGARAFAHGTPRRAAQENATSSAAVFAFLAGDRPAARRLAHAAEEIDGVFSAAAFREVGGPPRTVQATALPDDAAPAADALPWAAKLRAPDDFLHGLLDYVVEHDAGAMVRALVASPAPDESEKDAWFLAAGGDGVGLARWLRKPTSQPGTFLRYGASLLRTGRTEVAHWVRWGYRPVVAFHPMEEVVHLATLADAAESLGDAEGAAALRERTRRFREALLRRDTSVVLGVLDRI